MHITTRAALTLAVTAIALGPPAVAGATTPPPPSSEAPDSALPADDPFCAAGFVIADAETVLDDEEAAPEVLGSHMRQLVRAASRAAEVAPPEVGDLDELVDALDQLAAHYAEHGYDPAAAQADPDMAPLVEAYEQQLEAADATEGYVEDRCAPLLADDATRTEAFCAAMERLGLADGAFTEERQEEDPAVVERSFGDYLQAFDEARVIAPEGLRGPWDDARLTLAAAEMLLIEREWDYADATADPAFDEVTAAYEAPEYAEWTAELRAYVTGSCEPAGPSATAGTGATTPASI